MGRFLGSFNPVPETPGYTDCIKGVLGASGASAMHFDKFSGGRSPFKTPNPDPEGPGPLSFWSNDLLCQHTLVIKLNQMISILF